ncbi:hypothetical protein [Sporosarcina sp. JAI121]|uniref:hypothetical protein n=1 Tax=Sporosarcina sp. JAI121 TaxID=2723064 RepID=UPI0015C6E35F|nr:hypothetical protein [Sporosarcina sp. JAI121]NYF24582.1 hypothetical protein [Sporosarcina sp. JAI121]
MDIPIILLIIGLISIFASFIIGKSSSDHAEELEKVSISLHQETNGIKKRLKAVEEELMIGAGSIPSKNKTKKQTKPVHEIIVNQILSLHAQGYSVKDIAKRSSLTSEDVISVLQLKGVIV